MIEDDGRPMIGYSGARFGGASRRKTRKRTAATEADQRIHRPGDPRRDTEVIPTVPAPGPAPSAESVTANAGEADAAGGPVVGDTGARFPRRRRAGSPRRRRSPPAREQEESVRAICVLVVASPTQPRCVRIEFSGGSGDMKAGGRNAPSD
jgi:hypothetical protein